MSNRAWVTLATNDSYGLGALVLAYSLRRVGSASPAVVLITPAVTEAMRERLRAVYAEVITVDVLDSRDAAHLALLQRPELGITFTKIHCWNLTQYEKCVFLDADTLVVQNCDELFEREELSAAPDVGWPDCFNSGVFVFRPSQETFEKLIKFAKERGSFDGGDQGLLNSFFSDWPRGDINKHLPFVYNVTSAAFYSYLPALKQYGQNLKIIHFIGATKPWLQKFNWDTRTVDAQDHLKELLQLWWDLFVGQVHPQLDVSMSGVAGNLARVVPGAAGFQREALDELTRRQGWEAGNIDYMGADSFANIWAKISQTLTQPRSSPPKESPPKEPTPPPKQTPPKESPPKEPTPLPKQTPPKESAPKESTPPPKQTPPKESPPKETTPPPKEQLQPETKITVAPVNETVQEPVSEPIEVAIEVLPTATVPAPEKPAAEVEDPVTVKEITLTETLIPSETPVPVELSTPIETAKEAIAPVEARTVPASVETESSPQETLETAKEEAKEKTDSSVVPTTPPAIPKSIPKVSTPVIETPLQVKDVTPVETPIAAAATPESSFVTQPPSTPAVSESTLETTSESTLDASAISTDSPPLAHTPSKEDPPPIPAAKCPNRACSLM